MDSTIQFQVVIGTEIFTFDLFAEAHAKYESAGSANAILNMVRTQRILAVTDELGDEVTIDLLDEVPG